MNKKTNEIETEVIKNFENDLLKIEREMVLGKAKIFQRQAIENVILEKINKKTKLNFDSINKEFLTNPQNNEKVSFLIKLLNLNIGFDEKEIDYLLKITDLKQIQIETFSDFFKYLNFNQLKYVLENIDVNLKNNKGNTFFDFNGIVKKINDMDYSKIIKNLDIKNLNYIESFSQILNNYNYEDKKILIENLSFKTKNQYNMNICDFYFRNKTSIELPKEKIENWLSEYDFDKIYSINKEAKNLLLEILNNLEFSTKVLSQEQIKKIIEKSNYLNNNLNEEILKHFNYFDVYLNEENYFLLKEKLNFNFSFNKNIDDKYNKEFIKILKNNNIKKFHEKQIFYHEKENYISADLTIKSNSGFVFLLENSKGKEIRYFLLDILTSNKLITDFQFLKNLDEDEFDYFIKNNRKKNSTGVKESIFTYCQYLEKDQRLPFINKLIDNNYYVFSKGFHYIKNVLGENFINFYLTSKIEYKNQYNNNLVDWILFEETKVDFLNDVKFKYKFNQLFNDYNFNEDKKNDNLLIIFFKNFSYIIENKLLNEQQINKILISSKKENYSKISDLIVAVIKENKKHFKSNQIYFIEEQLGTPIFKYSKFKNLFLNKKINLTTDINTSNNIDSTDFNNNANFNSNKTIKNNFDDFLDFLETKKDVYAKEIIVLIDSLKEFKKFESINKVNNNHIKYINNFFDLIKLEDSIDTNISSTLINFNEKLIEINNNIKFSIKEEIEQKKNNMQVLKRVI